MASTVFFSLFLLLLSGHGVTPAPGFTRRDFPPDFVFGAATSAYHYQYEGAVAEDGRSPSIWDTFTHAGKMVDKSTGDVAADGYHKYKDDVKLMADTNLEAYRFSISWSRLIPNGRGAVNPKGLEYYNNLIDALVQHGIQVHIMIYQLDYPQILEDEYGGWLSPRIVEDFTEFADICFKEFGDRVSYWTTLDEPNVGAIGSYDSSIIAPGHCSDPFGITKCTVGNSTVEPYIAAHNMLLAHASATRLYREKYQICVYIKGVLHVGHPKGVVGLNIYSLWAYPFSNSTVDLEATKRCMDFTFGWILEPLMSGDYPKTMKNIVGSRLPSFTRTQSEAVIGSVDFIGINHYFSVYVNDRPLDKCVRDYTADLSITYKTSKTDSPAAGKFPPSSYPTDPNGLQLALLYLKEACGDIPIYIQENGNASSNDTLDDTDRLEYLKSYIGGTLTALRNGANVKGYFTWAFLDVFEFLAGYQSRYGLYRVDFDDEALPRHARLSARWYSGFLKNNDIHVQSELNNPGSHAEQ